MIDQLQERRRFETEYARLYPTACWKAGKFERDQFGEYEDTCVQVGWAMWLAASSSVREEARNAALEQAADWIDRRRWDFEREHGSTDHETGTMEFGTGNWLNKEEYDSELGEIAEEIRALQLRPSLPVPTAEQQSGGRES
jgi:hypothetical protein